LLFERHRRPCGSGRASRHRTGTIAVERTDGTHQFATHTLMLRLPVLPAESFTLTERVVAPFALDAVFHGSVAGRSPFVSVHTVRPLAVTVNVLLPAAALSTQIVTHLVPLTVAPAAGLVKAAVIATVFFTVTDRVAVARPPAESCTVSASVCGPSATLVVLHTYDVVLPLTVFVETTVPSTASWNVFETA